MDKSVKAFVLAAGLAAVSASYAQSDKPPTGTGDPSAASTPHQRSTTGAESKEMPAGGSPEATGAATPHQNRATGEGGPGDAALKLAHQDGMVPDKFVKKAAMDGMTEVELGQLALSKSQDPKIRAFAQRMVTDHGKANKELATTAKSRNIQVPTKLDAEHQAMVQTLSAKSGADFDAAYAEHMNAAHAKAIALFEGGSNSSDKELSALAKKTLPTLKEHKEMAEGLPATRTAGAADGKSKR